MPSLSTYQQKLLDPRWQRKRLELMEAAEFTCQSCGATDKTLHVHHGYYEKGRDPWEYPNDTMHVLCSDCHPKIQKRLTELQKLVALLDLDGTGGGDALDRILGFARMEVADELLRDEKRESVPVYIDNAEDLMAIGDWCGFKSASEVYGTILPLLDKDHFIHLRYAGWSPDVPHLGKSRLVAE